MNISLIPFIAYPMEHYSIIERDTGGNIIDAQNCKFLFYSFEDKQLRVKIISVSYKID